jgi:hypothetical protein
MWDTLYVVAVAPRKELTARIQDISFICDSSLHCWPRLISLVRPSGEKQAAIRRAEFNSELDDCLKKPIDIIEYTTCKKCLEITEKPEVGRC